MRENGSFKKIAGVATTAVVAGAMVGAFMLSGGLGSSLVSGSISAGQAVPGIGVTNQCVPANDVVARLYLNVPVANGHVWAGLYDVNDTSFSNKLGNAVFHVWKSSWKDATFSSVTSNTATAYVVHAIDNDIYRPSVNNPIANSPALTVCTGATTATATVYLFPTLTQTVTTTSTSTFTTVTSTIVTSTYTTTFFSSSTAT